jgi:leucyl aminopeptidase
MADVLSVDVVSRGNQDGAELIVLGAFEGEAPELDGFGEDVRAAVARLAGRPGWKGRDEQSAQTDLGVGAGGGTVIALSGLGKRDDLSPVRMAGWISRAAELAKSNGFRHALLVPPRHAETEGGPAAERAVRLMALAAYRFDRHSEEKNGPRLERISVAPPAGQEETWRAAVAFSIPVAEAVAFSRTLANTPPNEATPLWMAERAREMADSRGVEVTILDEEEIARRGMGCLQAVGAGSSHPPRLVRLAWGDSGPAIALVGKGVTFDTGGISIKPSQHMEDMKYDKCGACVVLGMVRAVADLGLEVRVRAYLPLAENMPGGNAFRPGDILRAYNGRTVEVTNTDAEGRLILADALSWAAEEKPDALLEYSTLTGGMVVALGSQAAGLFTPDDGLAGEVQAASAESGERIWRMPLYPEYLEDMKSLHADIRNSAGRAGAACTAAAFLSQFVGGLKSWGHMDVAGTSYVAHEGARRGGATGFGIASAVAWLRHRAGQKAE